MVMAVNGTLLDPVTAQKLKDSGIQRISISLDGASAESHDFFRQVEGAFAGALKGAESARAVGLEFQITTTVTQYNLNELVKIQEVALNWGQWPIIFLCYAHRRAKLIDQTISIVTMRRH
jgi:MoaA/NifB/PqqE/SkfB family radical SAM enzyme